MTTVAVIGGGVAGMGAAQVLLQAGLEVVLLESARRLGGNCLGVTVRDADGRRHVVDAGVSDFNRTTFTEVSRLIDGLGLQTQAICCDADFVTVGGRSRASYRDGTWRLDASVSRPDAVAQEISRFRLRAEEVLTDERFLDWSVARYLDHLGVSASFRHLILYPRAMGCFPMPDRDPGDQSIRGLVSFWKVHGLVGAAPANRHCVVGGMHRYARALERRLVQRGAEILCGTRVLGIVRHADRVEVRAVDVRDRHHRREVDHVLLTGHAHETLPLLEDPSRDERRVLGRFPFQRARLVVHQDPRLMGHERAAWGAFNYVIPEGGHPRVRPTITFHPNRLARLGPEVPDVFVTMNPHREPRPKQVLVSRFFLHPVADASSRAAIPQVERLQGRRRTWFAGGYLRMPFVHESALRSGQRIARRVVRAERAAEEMAA